MRRLVSKFGSHPARLWANRSKKLGLNTTCITSRSRVIYLTTSLAYIQRKNNITARRTHSRRTPIATRRTWSRRSPPPSVIIPSSEANSEDTGQRHKGRCFTRWTNTLGRPRCGSYTLRDFHFVRFIAARLTKKSTLKRSRLSQQND